MGRWEVINMLLVRALGFATGAYTIKNIYHLYTKGFSWGLLCIAIGAFFACLLFFYKGYGPKKEFRKV